MLQVVPILNTGGAHVIDIGHELRRSFDEVLDRWGDRLPPGNHTPTVVTGITTVLAALGALDHALDRLGNRDRGGVRDALINQRASLAASIAALESLAGDGRPLGDIRQFRPVGPRYRELADRYEQAYAAQQQAQSAMYAATRDTVLARRAELDLAEADAREVSREIDALRTAAVFPTVLLRGFVEPFAQAEQQTKDLASLAGIRSQPARALFAALEQGRTAPAAVARLWICFEPAKDVAGDLMAWRLRAYNEEHGQ